MTDSFPGSDSTRQSTEREQYLDDLRMVCDSPEGFRVLIKIIGSLGAGGYAISSEPGYVAMFNKGEQIINDIAQANPTAALRLIAAIRGIEM